MDRNGTEPAAHHQPDIDGRRAEAVRLLLNAITVARARAQLLQRRLATGHPIEPQALAAHLADIEAATRRMELQIQVFEPDYPVRPETSPDDGR